jgi:hypothetical protein
MMIKSDTLQTAVLMKAGPTIHSHGHHDHLSVQYFNSGQLLLLDSGGPFKYSDPNREYFKHPRAHNTLTTKGQSTFDFDVSEHDISHILANDFNHLGASHKLSEKLSHSRNTLYISDIDLFLCHDHITASSFVANQGFEKFWHFPPGSKVSKADSSTNNQFYSKIILANGNIYSCQIICDGELHVKVIEGQLSPHTQGWVTTKIGSMEKAPVIEVSLASNGGSTLSCMFAIWPEFSPGNTASTDNFIQLKDNDIHIEQKYITRHFCFNKHQLVCARSSHKSD